MLSRAALRINHHALERVNALSQKITCRSMHVVYRVRSVDLGNRSVFKVSRHSSVLTACTIRNLSTTGGAATTIAKDASTEKLAETTTTTTTTELLTKIPEQVTESVAGLLENVPEQTIENVSELLKNVPEQTMESVTDLFENIPEQNMENITDLLENISGEQVTEDATAEIQENIPGEQIVETSSSELLKNIPDAPIAPEIIQPVVSLTDPPFSELGLGGWWPPGIIQQCLEGMHVTWGLPWWEAIVLGTVFIRILVFPLVIKSQRNVAHMNNHMPEMTRLQSEFQEAKMCGDHLLVARKGRELNEFMKTHHCNPLKTMLVPLAQAPIFISVFFGLRKMAELPVVSMEEGGLWWFKDLTVADPYYALPLITCVTLAITLEIGTDVSKAGSLGMMRYFLRAVPVIMFPFIYHFPTAILCYWTATNMFSLVQVSILRLPRIREFFEIEPLIKHPRIVDPRAPKGFVAGFKGTIKNIKQARELGSRDIADDAQFNKAGRGPVQETFVFNPIKKIEKTPSLLTKKR